MATLTQPLASSLMNHALKARSHFGRFWCTLAHNSPLWPMKGRYQCGKCFLYHPVRWEITADHREHRSAKQPRYPGRMPRGLGAADLERILARATKIERENLLQRPTERKKLGCGHEDEVRLGIDSERAVCGHCRANGVRYDDRNG